MPHLQVHAYDRKQREFFSLQPCSLNYRAAQQVRFANTIDTYLASAQKSKCAQLFVGVFR